VVYPDMVASQGMLAPGSILILSLILFNLSNLTT